MVITVRLTNGASTSAVRSDARPRPSSRRQPLMRDQNDRFAGMERRKAQAGKGAAHQEEKKIGQGSGRAAPQQPRAGGTEGQGP